MNPPMVYDETIPSSQSIIRIIAMVYSITVLLSKAESYLRAG